VEMEETEGTSFPKETQVKVSRKEETMEMVKPDQVELILEMRARPLKIKKIARLLGLARNTVKRVLRAGRTAAVRQPQTRVGLVAPFGSYLMERAAQVEYNAWRLFMELQGMGYTGGYGRVKAYVRPIRQKPAQPDWRQALFS